jgi:hypothetical protein
MSALLRFPIERSPAELVRGARAFGPNIIATARQALCPLLWRRWFKKMSSRRRTAAVQKPYRTLTASADRSGIFITPQDRHSYT